LKNFTHILLRHAAGLLGVLAITFGAATSQAANIHKLTAKKGSNTAGMNARVPASRGVGAKFAGLKAQNHLSTAMNQLLTKEKAGVGGGLGSPGYKNGTVDTLPYFNSWFITGYRNSVYTYSMVGHSPTAGGTTTITNRILPLVIVLFDANNNPLYIFDPTGGGACGAGSDIALTAKSPLYDATTTYPGGVGLPADMGQLVDTTQRASFKGVKAANWHTPLGAPQNADCSTSGYYVVGLDPTAWVYLVDSGNNIVGEAMDINVISNVFESLLQLENSLYGLPNSVLPIILTDTISAYDPFDLSCCVLGYHTAETGISNPAGILVWTWAGFQPVNTIFGAFGDVAVLSHEVTELYNDPFVNTLVAPWVDGSVSFAQADLETGDAVEAMADVDTIFNVFVNGFQYHVQNEALLPWFTRNPKGPVNGPGPGVYSWPNTNTLNNGHNPAGWVYGEAPAGFYFGPPF
jgi:hypothetical protein